VRIEILKRTTVTGSVVLPGDCVEVADRDGRYLIGLGKARLAPEPICPVILQQPDLPERQVTRKPRTRKGI
jgi:hypothetical protein